MVKMDQNSSQVRKINKLKMQLRDLFQKAINLNLLLHLDIGKSKKSFLCNVLKIKLRPCDMEGIMFKKGKKSKSWTKRYFELRDHFLFYYEKKEDKKPKGKK